MAKLARRSHHLTVINADGQHLVKRKYETHPWHPPPHSHHRIESDVPAVMEVHDIGLVAANEIDKIPHPLVVAPDFMHDVVVIDGKDRLVGIYHLDGRSALVPGPRNRARQKRFDSM